jgi:hypothetical protein
LGRGGLRRLKAGPLEAEWELEAERTEAQLGVDALPPRAGTDGPISSELDAVARRAPAAAVLEAFARIERELRRRLEDAGVDPGARVGAVRLARLAAEHSVTSETNARAVEGLAVMRNLAAHGRTRVGEHEAHEFLALADGVLYALGQPPDARPAGDT